VDLKKAPASTPDVLAGFIPATMAVPHANACRAPPLAAQIAACVAERWIAATRAAMTKWVKRRV